MAEASRYVPALGRDRLTGLYDPVVRLTTRESEFKTRLLDQAGLVDGMEVLDLGCGTGTLAIQAKARAPGAWVGGLDGDPRMLAKARDKAGQAGVAVHFDEGLADRLPYAGARFDRVLSSLFFHHLSADTKDLAIREVARVLKPGGELHVADFGPPTDPVMAVLSLSIRLLDGFGPTRQNFAGALPGVFERNGLGNARMRDRLRTMHGSIAFYSAVRA